LWGGSGSNRRRPDYELAAKASSAILVDESHANTCEKECETKLADRIRTCNRPDDSATDPCYPTKQVGQLGGLSLKFPANFMLMRRSASRVIAVAFAAGVVLSACSSTDRSAAPAEDDVVTEQVTEAVEELASEPEPVVEADQDLASDSDADAGSVLDVEANVQEDSASSVPETDAVGSVFRGVRLCVKNDRTTLDGRPAAIDVDMSSASTSHEGTFLNPTVENCGKTDTRLIMGEIQIMYTDAKAWTFKAQNLVPGDAQLEMSRGVAGDACVYVDTEGRSKSYDDGFARYVLTRLNDSKEFKEFQLTVQDSRGETKCDAWW